jgi:DNA-binding transcriptional MerR regulator/methylmalonyl-CoA mutase cobalamin-binding subunit
MSSKPLPDARNPEISGANWSIGEVERETGLGKDTLRVWERRYGFPVPQRDALGERSYPEDQLHRLRLIKRLLDAGQRPGKVVPLSPQALQTQLDDVADADRKSQSANQHETLLNDPEHEWLQWLSQDKTHLIKQALQQKILRSGLGPVVDQWVAPLCGWVGLAWMRGQISVYQEHLFTETLQSVLREAIASVDSAGHGLQRQPRVLLTTTPNELHGLGLLMAECHFALESCERFVLGTSTPISDIVQAVKQLKIDVLALSFSPYASRKDVVENLQQLREQLSEEVDIWVGGTAAHANRRALPERVVVMRKAGDVSAQVQAWRQQHQR